MYNKEIALQRLLELFIEIDEWVLLNIGEELSYSVLIQDKSKILVLLHKEDIFKYSSWGGKVVKLPLKITNTENRVTIFRNILDNINSQDIENYLKSKRINSIEVIEFTFIDMLKINVKYASVLDRLKGLGSNLNNTNNKKETRFIVIDRN